MKKMIFLMLLSFLGITTGMNAQVTIGSSSDPHPSAILDLESTTQGLKLPTVVLTSRTTFLDNGGDKTAAKGMLVYNTGSSFEGPGLYVWSGSSWIAVSTINCSTPAIPTAITFSPALTNDIVRNTLITATTSLTDGATSYTWSVPAGLEIVGDATGRSVKIRATAIGNIEASGITVQATNECSSSDARAGVGTVKVIACQEGVPPAIPALNINSARVSVNNPVKITCGDVGATEYHWTLPDGITAPSTTTTENSILVTVTDEGYYYANTFKVNASNSCGATSDDKTGIGGCIVAGECTQKPSDPYIAPIDITKVSGSTFTVAVSTTSKGKTTYEWSVPTGLSIVSGNGTYLIAVEATTVGNYNAGNIKVKVINDCGDLTVNASGTIKVVAPGSPGTDLAGANGTYTTSKYPLGLGTWMTTNSKEGDPTRTTSPGHGEGERGYYYTSTAAPSACPWDGWSLPTIKQLTDLTTYLSSTLSSVTAVNEPWISNAVLAGRALDSADGWDERLWLRGTGTSVRYYNKLTNSFSSTNSNGDGMSVRCIKSCDEAPYIASVSFLNNLLPTDVPIKMWVTASSIDTPAYQWYVPNDAEIIEGATSDTVYVKFNSPISFDGSALGVKVSNECGESSKSYVGRFNVISDKGHEGSVLDGDNGSYATYVFPADLGTWMNSKSKEGTPTQTQYPGHEEGERGYYYGRDVIESACPAEWRIPTGAEVRAIFGFVADLCNVLPELSDWNKENSAGFFRVANETWDHWGNAAQLMCTDGNYSIIPGFLNVAQEEGSGGQTATTVRCIKE